MTNMENLLKMGELKRRLAVSDKTIYRTLIPAGLPFYKVGDRYRFKWEEVVSWLRTHRKDKLEEIL